MQRLVVLHANVAVHANDRDALERLASYLARDPLATKRLSQLADGRLAYALKRRRYAKKIGHRPSATWSTVRKRPCAPSRAWPHIATPQRDLEVG